MAQIVMFGAGKVADVVSQHIEREGKHDIVAFTVDGSHLPNPARFRGKPIVPFEEAVTTFPPNRFGMIVALGYHDLNAVRKSKYEAAKAAGYTLHSYVSPRAATGPWLQTGENCIVLDNATVEPGTRLGNDVVVWSNVLVGHHTTIEDHCWIAGQAVFGGSARLGAESFVGLGAVVAHEVEIGERSFIGAGALVTKCCDAKSVFVAAGTERFRLDSDRFLKISKIR